MQAVTDTFDRSYQATPDSIGRVRADVATFVRERGMDAHRIDDIRLVVSEAVTNAVRHAYRGASGTVHVSAHFSEGALWLSVRDFGQGIQPRPIVSAQTGMGLGLALIERLVGEFWISPQPGGGTDLRMRFDLVGARAPAPRSMVA